MSTLENGVYAITNNAGNRHVGRFPIEELTLLPKPLMALPRGVEGPNVRANDRVILVVSHAFYAVVHDPKERQRLQHQNLRCSHWCMEKLCICFPSRSRQIPGLDHYCPAPAR